jgi:hypothetical protein
MIGWSQNIVMPTSDLHERWRIYKPFMCILIDIRREGQWLLNANLIEPLTHRQKRKTICLTAPWVAFLPLKLAMQKHYRVRESIMSASPEKHTTAMWSLAWRCTVTSDRLLTRPCCKMIVFAFLYSRLQVLFPSHALYHCSFHSKPFYTTQTILSLLFRK